jgi:MATE family multidrug resistance protein
MIWFNAESVLLLLRQDPEVAHLAGVYLKWASLGLPAYAFNCVSRYDIISPSIANILTNGHQTGATFNLKVMNDITGRDTF